MTLYVGSGIREWPGTAPKHVRWLISAPLEGAAVYPPILDIAEEARLLAEPVVTAACDALAPTWVALKRYGLTASLLDRSEPERNELFVAPLTSYLERNAVHPRYLVEAFAQALAGLGPGFGAILRGVENWDTASGVFVRRLLSESRVTGFHVALQVQPKTIQKQLKPDALEASVIVQPHRSLRRQLVQPNDRFAQLLSLCPHGLPRQMASRLVGDLPSGVEETMGPGGRPWVYIPINARVSVARRLSEVDVQSLHNELFDKWSVESYDYLRRGAHAIVAENLTCLLSHHLPYTSGMMAVAPTFVYQHMTALCSHLGGLALRAKDTVRLLTATGELAHGLPTARPQDLAIRHLRAALKLAKDTASRISTMCELSNAYAFKRTVNSLLTARKWCERARPLLMSLPDGPGRVRLEIRLANTLALVEYREGRGEHALVLELEARQWAIELRDRYPEIENWARPLLNRNIAQVLERVFVDRKRAIAFLVENLAFSQAPSTREKDVYNLARLYFDVGDHSRAAELFGQLYEHEERALLNDEQELYGRAMLAIALLAIGSQKRAARQIRHLTSLARGLDAGAGLNFAADLKREIEGLSTKNRANHRFANRTGRRGEALS